MNLKDRQQIKTILEAALALPRAERSAFVDRSCTGRPEIQREVKSLLEADTGEAEQFERAAFDFRAAEDPAPLAIGAQVGPYRLQEVLGQGGNGVVYRAERVDGAFEQEVAIKVLRKGLDSAEIASRFQAERQILAKLVHANIARLLDGGATEDGRLYFAMELVSGVPIDEFCEEQGLSIEERLRLFQQVCAAVQHAHQKLVVHRDLKPQNILVTPEGQPKLLDFGIAKLLESEGTGNLTLEARRLTPDYASPEQVSGGEISTATDVYLLGLVLYELLSGDSAHAVGRRAGAEELERVVCQQEPEKPSVVASRVAKKSSIASRLRGDLDAIVMMALRKEPERRYPTPAALSADIGRHLAGQAVKARPDRFAYRAGKFLKRNVARVGVGTLLLIFAAITTVVFYRQHQRTIEERDRAEAVSEFLETIFAHSDPQIRNTPSTTARELLDQAVERIEDQLGQVPQAKARLLLSLGSAYLNLGLHDQATSILREAAELSKRHAPESALLGEALHGLGALSVHKGEFQLAQEYLRDAVAIRKKTHGIASEEVASSLNTLGLAYKCLDMHAEAEASYREAVAIRRLDRGGGLPLARSLHNLGSLMRTLNRYREAEKLILEAIELKAREIGPDHPSTATTVHGLGRLYKDQGKYEQSKQQYLRAEGIVRRSLGNQHPHLAQNLDSLGVVLLRLGEYPEAEKAFAEALGIRQKALRADHPDTAKSHQNLGVHYSSTGAYPKAEKSFREAVRILEKSLGVSHARTLRSRASLATALEMQGQLEDAEALMLSCLGDLEKKEPIDRREVASLKRNIAILLAKTSRHEETERFAREASSELRALLGEKHPDTAQSDSVLGGVLLLQRRLQEAEPLLRSSYEVLLATRGPEAIATKETVKRIEALEKLKERLP